MTANQRRFFGKEIIVAFLVLSPLLILNTRNSVHWGDDFAQYIHQAKNIAEGKKFYDTGLAYRQGFSSFAPAAPVGFSVLLVPVYKIYGLNILAYSIYLSAWFVLWALLGFVFFRSYFSFLPSLCLLVLAFYPNFMLWMKLLITSDVPFSFLFLLVLLLYLSWIRKSNRGLFLIGCIAGFMISIRPVGWLFPIAVFAENSLQIIRQYNTKKKWEISAAAYRDCFIISSAALMVYLFIGFVFPPPVNNYISYQVGLMDLSKVFHSLAFNSLHYSNSFISLFESSDPGLIPFSRVAGYGILLCALVGYILKVYRYIDIVDILVPLYLMVILVSAFIADYRYLIPVHVFLITYASFTGKFLLEKLKVRKKVWILPVFLLSVIALYSKHIEYIIQTRHYTLPGPCEEICRETFQYIHENVPDTSLIVFYKPRALALFTGKRATSPQQDTTAQYNYRELKKMGAEYYLYDLSTDWIVNCLALKQLIDDRKDSFELVYKNWRFELYKEKNKK